MDVDAPDLRVNFVLRKGRGLLSVDLGGGALHRRGWRQSQGEAPLKENLAAAMLLRGDWPRIHAEGGALLDPMCGSGTLLIEGALMAADEAPGLLRWRGAQPSRWLRLRHQAWARTAATKRASAPTSAAPRLQPVFLGADSDPQGAARGAGQCRPRRARRTDAPRSHADRRVARSWRPSAGWSSAIRPTTSASPPMPACTASSATPCAVRSPAWRASLLCGDEELAHATGLRAQQEYTMFNGTLECTLLLCDPVQPPQREPRAAGAARRRARTMVANRLRKNLKRLKSWRTRDGIDCYRVYDADLPEYSAAVDLYQECDGEQRLFLHVQEYAAPRNDPGSRQQATLRRTAGRAARGVPAAARAASW